MREEAKISSQIQDFKSDHFNINTLRLLFHMSCDEFDALLKTCLVDRRRSDHLPMSIAYAMEIQTCRNF